MVSMFVHVGTKGLLACKIVCRGWCELLTDCEAVWRASPLEDRCAFFLGAALKNVGAHAAKLGCLLGLKRADLYAVNQLECREPEGKGPDARVDTYYPLNEAILAMGFVSDLSANPNDARRSDLFDTVCAQKHLRSSEYAPSAVEQTLSSLDTLLLLENSHRHVGVQGGVFRIELTRPCHMNRTLDHGVTVLRSQRDHYNDLWTMREDYAHMFSLMAPAMGGFDLTAHGMVVAGGAASALATGCALFDDVDVFLIHKSEERAWAAITALARHLHDADACMKCTRTTNTVSFELKDMPVIQVVLRLYNTISEIVHGFDLGSCAFAFDGEVVLTTHLGQYALAHRVNILDLSVRRPTYETRILKYMSRGWGLALPNFGYRECENGIKKGKTVLPYLLGPDNKIMVLRQAGYFGVNECACRLMLTSLALPLPQRRLYEDYNNESDEETYDGEAADKKVRFVRDLSFDTTCPYAPPARWQYADDGVMTHIGLEHDEFEEQEKAYKINIREWGKHSTLLDNMKEVIKLRTGGDAPVEGAVKAVAPYAPGLDMRSIPPVFEAKAIEDALKSRLPHASAHQYLEKCTGLAADQITDLGTRAGTSREVSRIAIDLASELTSYSYRIPFRFMRAEDNTRLTGPATVSEEALKVWYGAAYRA
jgi:hypothetical protein